MVMVPGGIFISTAGAFLGIELLTAIVLLAASIIIAWTVGGKTGTRYEAMWLTCLLGVLGLAIWAFNLATDSTRPHWLSTASRLAETRRT